MKRIAIILEGGVVHNVLSEEEIDVIVVDYDVEGLDDEDITRVSGNDAYVTQFSAEVNVSEINEILGKE